MKLNGSQSLCSQSHMSSALDTCAHNHMWLVATILDSEDIEMIVMVGDQATVVLTAQ